VKDLFSDSLQGSARGRPRIVSTKPESGDAKDVHRVFGIKESLLYDLDRRGLVKSVVIPGRGKSGRGKRLYLYSSIRKLLAAEEAASAK
jgi:hypothetical protein